MHKAISFVHVFKFIFENHYIYDNRYISGFFDTLKTHVSRSIFRLLSLLFHSDSIVPALKALFTGKNACNKKSHLLMVAHFRRSCCG